MITMMRAPIHTGSFGPTMWGAATRTARPTAPAAPRTARRSFRAALAARKVRAPAGNLRTGTTSRMTMRTRNGTLVGMPLNGGVALMYFVASEARMPTMRPPT